MTSLQQKGLSSERIHGQPPVNANLLECPICHDILWKPVACQSCETSFCSTCIMRWISDNPNNCPNRCETYTERKCPPLTAKLLAQLQVTCFYQPNGCQEIVSYEALDKHEIDCGYTKQQCPGCRSNLLKKDFDNHQNNCALIKLTCEDCQLVYKRGDSTTQHTKNLCLERQLREMREEMKNKKFEIQELTSQLGEICFMNPLLTSRTITFADLPAAKEKALIIPKVYKGYKWSEISYAHESYWKEKYPKSGYAACLSSGGSPHIAYFVGEGSIGVEHADKTFTFVSLTACAAWNDDLQLTITGHRNSMQMNTHATTLLFGKPQRIILRWKDIDNVILKSSGGTAHPGSGGGVGSHVVITQLTISQPD